jgi:O-antigen ligase
MPVATGLSAQTVRDVNRWIGCFVFRNLLAAQMLALARFVFARK